MISGKNDSASLGQEVTMEELHRTLGHVSKGYLEKLLTNESLEKTKVTKLDKGIQCKACILGKATKNPIAHHRTME